MPLHSGIDDEDEVGDGILPIFELPVADLELLEAWVNKSSYVQLMRGEVLSEWTDDHQPCFNVSFVFSVQGVVIAEGPSERTLEFGCWWSDARLAGWVDLSGESATGREKIREHLADSIKMAILDKRTELADIARMEDR